MQSSQETIKLLQQAIAKQDLPQILKLSTLLMKQNPQDLQYKQCYSIAAIKSKEFTQLANGIFKQKPHDKGLQRIFYYYLYASGQYHKCVQALGNTKDHGLQLLLAQSYFNILEYDRSIQIMGDLLKIVKLNHDQKQLYMINLLASTTPKSQGRVQQYQFLITQNSCKEMFYNYSLFLYTIGNTKQALKYLQSFQSALEKQDQIDRITAKLFRDYIAMTSNQQILFNKQNKLQEYRNLLKTIKDDNLKCVLTNNLIFLSNNVDQMSDHYKNLQQLNDPKAKLSLMQLIALRINKLSYLNRKNRTHDSLKIIHQLEGQSNLLNSNQFIMNKYYALKKAKDFENAEKYIRNIMPQNVSLGFCLLVDLCQQTHNTKSIIDFLQTLSKADNEHAKNYIFSLLIKDANLFSQYSGYLDDLIKKSTETKILQILLKLYENKNDKQKQISILNRILQINPKNASARVGLAEIYMQNKQISKAEDLIKGIQKPNEITDINYLQYIEKNIHVSKKQQDTPATEEQKKQPHKKRIKKKKRVKLPKNVEKPTPGFKPDPERWLPKWQRKGYKKKGKKGGNKTQGLSTVGTEQKNVYNVANSTSAKEVTKQANKRRK